MTQESGRGRVVVLAGPSAVGKSTVVSKLRESVPNLFFSVSMTTRDPRPGEVHGRDYLYVTRDEFQSNIDSDLMLEWAEIHGGLQLSGTPRKPVEEAMAAQRPVLIEVDLEGARNVKKILPEAHTVFLAPPSWEVLVDRLTGRGTESDEVIQRRLETARGELAAKGEFDHVIVNSDVDEAVAGIRDILVPKA
ncbi:guanylate kinase [Corynebacterium urealyticum]|uniref:guanylate kinase n=1 Tax=Corynebacterium urealyticum TaxID=43771 RepID=UPI0011E7D125|nr:guanylate kinase [Corynebacterium urealyticum]TYR14940.1 guanylate kinase [Corynebacterium urealyticum]TYT21660.1 guanylate kinase [Corynebacterium urealyticum]